MALVPSGGTGSDLALAPLSPSGETRHILFGVVPYRTEESGTWIQIPTSSLRSRTLLRALCTTDEERRVADTPSVDVEMRVSPAEFEDLGQFFAKLLRRESYFRALLIQSRGHRVRPCNTMCNGAQVSRKFRTCRRLDTFLAGACAECVYQTLGARCEHLRDGTVLGPDSPMQYIGYGSSIARSVAPSGSAGSRLNPLQVDD